MNTNYEVKVFKSANNQSTMDVQSLLTGKKMYNEKETCTDEGYHQSEYSYSGRMIFTICEHGKTSAKAFVPKKRMKPLLHSIINHTFHKLYGVNEGMKGADRWENFGHKNGTGRKISILFNKYFNNKKNKDVYQYIVQIEEGPVNENNSFVHGQTKRVKKMFSLEEMTEMAHEVYDFIHHEELKGMLNDRPLFTVMTNKSQTKNNAQAL
ncbi:hypothetical protein AB3N04_00870 (plasmid) [Alkalihalophilus sp. As8PL]|uniref:Uncharacterized protein n=1 Tax=Alkalihalophilus sp. As8PL TaxID=3237103 RepID=A0AB39BMK6_9BACI